MKNNNQKPTTKQWLTLEEKIEKILKEAQPEGETKEVIAKLKQLFLQTLHPEQFCPRCNNQLFLQDEEYICINCGYQPIISEDKTIENNVTKGMDNKKGKIPKHIEKIIKQVEKPRTTVPTKKGENIRQLVNQMENGNTQVTQDDIIRIKNQDSNVKNINFIK